MRPVCHRRYQRFPVEVIEACLINNTQLYLSNDPGGEDADH